MGQKRWRDVCQVQQQQLLKWQQPEQPNNQLLWRLLIKEQKKNEEINNFNSFKNSSVFSVEFSVW